MFLRADGGSGAAPLLLGAQIFSRALDEDHMMYAYDWMVDCYASSGAAI
ncbi:hypothetical protein [Mesorhizobium sp. STM 4661]|nr:hypothetical protein [Mesorhizobium sp. STM 4661]CCV10199.1 hypothetical protein MESS4_130004 [Mesorhizobium sp. STM 4661]